MAKERRITVRGIVFENGNLLAQQLHDKNKNQPRDYWCIPGGGLELGESLHAGLTREMIEETGVTPTIGKLLYIQQYEDDEREFLEFFFNIENPQDYHSIDLAATSHGQIEIAVVDFVDPANHVVLPDFLQTADIASAIASDQPVVIKSYL